ncbi:DUF3397 domain-containing protein [Neobacillus piezotolerans]|uniref:DUF3397 domain-containing protein n=1 Tax=Neobacillus piezotolerans TaxID=2259171 RepID=A0A3D8GWP0_9BACI|nr:DUF3397 domain-containing protein [Neobacillus piezotolerans]RDU38476.1 DUF3397 domain-containing protein [Neobacillus piezotolerans]
MSTILSSIFALFIFLPLLGYVLVFAICKPLLGSHRRSVGLALDATTFLLVISVHFLILTIWKVSFLWLIFVVLLSVGMAAAVFQWKTKGEVVWRKVFKGFWRFTFLLFFTAYVGLILFGLVERAIIAVQAS